MADRPGVHGGGSSGRGRGRGKTIASSSIEFMDENNDENVEKGMTPEPIVIRNVSMQTQHNRLGPEHFPVAWEVLTIKLEDAESPIDTSLHLTPCLVQFAIQNRTSETRLVFQDSGIQIEKVTVVDNMAKCEVKSNIKNGNSVQDQVLDTFISLTERLDFVEIRKGTEQYASVRTKKKEEFLMNVGRKAEIYSSSTGFYCVGESQIVQLVREMLHLKGEDHAAGHRADEEEKEIRKLINQFHDECSKLEEWIERKLPVTKSEELPKDETSCKQLLLELEQLQHDVAKKTSTDFKDLISLLENISKTTVQAEERAQEAGKTSGMYPAHQTRKTLRDKGLRKTMLRAHRQAWCWQDEYHGLKLADIRRLERETQLALQETMAEASDTQLDNEANRIETVEMNSVEVQPNKSSNSPQIQVSKSLDHVRSSVKRKEERSMPPSISSRLSVKSNSNQLKSAMSKSSIDSSQLSDWRFQSLEQLQESSSDEEEFYDAQEDLSVQRRLSQEDSYDGLMRDSVFYSDFELSDSDSDSNSAYFDDIARRLASLKQSLDNIYTKTQVNGQFLSQRLKCYKFLADCDKLDSLLDEDKGVCTTEDMKTMLTDINIAADELQLTDDGAITEKRRNALIEKWKHYRQIEKEQNRANSDGSSCKDPENGISKEDEERVQQETVREGQVEDDKGHTETGRPGMVKRGTESESDTETGHIAGDCDKTQLGDQTKMLERGTVHAVAKEAPGFDSNADTPKEHAMKPEERREEAGANTQLDKERLQETGDQHSGISFMMGSDDQKLLNRLGNMCVKRDGKTGWQSTQQLFDRYKLYFRLKTEQDYVYDKLKENKVGMSVGTNGIECILTDISMKDAEALRYVGNIIQEKVLSDYESVIIKKGSVEEEAFRQTFLDNIPLLVQSGDVMAFSDDTAGCLCIVGERDDVAPLKDNLMKQIQKVQRDDISKTAIKEGWEQDFITIKSGDITARLPQELPCCVIQFHCTGKRQKRGKRLLKEKDIDVEITDNSCCLSTHSKIGEDLLKEKVRSAVKEKLVPGFKILYFERKSTEAGRIINLLKETVTVPSDVKHGLVEVYYYFSSDKLCVIGKEGKCTDFLKNIQQQSDALPQEESAGPLQTGHTTTQSTDTSNTSYQTTPSAAYRNQQTELPNSTLFQEAPQPPDRNWKMASSQFKSVELDCTEEEFEWLQKLDFEQHFETTNAAKYVSVNLNNFPPTATGDSRYFAEVGEQVKTFIKRLKHQKVRFREKLCNQLLLNDDNKVNSTVLNYLNSSVRKYNKKSLAYCLNVSSEGEVTVTCRDEDSCNLVARVGDCIAYTDVGAEVADAFREHCNPDWKGKVKIVKEKKNMGILCTNDLSNNVINMIQKLVPMKQTLSLTSLMVEYLAKYGEGIVTKASSEIKAKVSVVQDEGLIFHGNSDQLKHLKSILKTTIPDMRRSIPIDVVEEEVQKCQVEVDSIADRFHCCWKIQTTKESNQRQLQNCSYIARWFDPLCSLQMTVVEGIAEDVEFDALVLLTSDSLFPYDECHGTAMHYLMQRGGKDFTTIVADARERYGNFSLGSIYQFPKAPGVVQAKSVYSIVVHSVVQNKYLSYQSLIQKISEVLLNLSEDHVTIAFKAAEVTKYLGLNKMIEAVFEGCIQFYRTNNTARVEVYLCCFNNTVSDVTKVLNKCFKQQPGCGRQGYDDKSIGFNSKENKIKVEVDVGSILEVNVDVIVNTVATDLDLSKGAVSNQILERAGPEIQQECIKLAPKGINQGEVVVTKAHKIPGKKHVIHGALANYNADMFQDHIKQFVKRCLYKAEQLPKCKKIAFPPLGVGNLKYPRRETACAMLDAFEEFRSEVMKPNITEIKLVLYTRDKPTCSAFIDEEWRRRRECQCVPKPVSQTGVKCLVPSVAVPNALCVMIAKKDEITRPSNAVEVLFKLEKWISQDKFKTASKDPKTWNDVLTIGVKYNAVKDGVERCLQICTDGRITYILIRTDKLSKETLEVIANELKISTNKYLKTAIIAVDSSCYDSLQKGALRKDWREASLEPGRKCRTSIELIGESSDTLDKAAMAIRSEIQKLKDESKVQPSQDTAQRSIGGISSRFKVDFSSQGARPKNSNTTVQATSSDNLVRTFTESDIFGDNLVRTVTGSDGFEDNFVQTVTGSDSIGDSLVPTITESDSYGNEYLDADKSHAQVQGEDNVELNPTLRISSETVEAEEKVKQHLESSEMMLDLYCHFCIADGKQLEASGFCNDCRKYVCTNCYTNHSTSQATGHHVLMARDKMPKDTLLSQVNLNKEIAKQCECSNGRTVEFYCKSHDIVLCSFCFFKNHRNCNVEIISDMSDSVLETTEYKDFMQMLNQSEQGFRDHVKLVQDNITKSKSRCSEVVNSVRKFKEEINAIFDQLEKGLLTKAELLHKEEESKLTDVSVKIAESLESLEKMIGDFNQMHASREVCELYIKLKESKKEANEIQTKLHEVQTENVVSVYTFDPNSQLKEFMKKEDILGNLSVQALVTADPETPTSYQSVNTTTAHVKES